MSHHITVQLTYRIRVPAVHVEQAKSALCHAEAPYQCDDLCWRIGDEVARLLGLPLVSGEWNAGCEAELEKVSVK